MCFIRVIVASNKSMSPYVITSGYVRTVPLVVVLLLCRNIFKSPLSMNGRIMYGSLSSVLRHTPNRLSRLIWSTFFIRTHSFKKVFTSSVSKTSKIHQNAWTIYTHTHTHVSALLESILMEQSKLIPQTAYSHTKDLPPIHIYTCIL